jgi:hypothetical protein
VAVGAGSVALGAGSVALGAGSVALGAGSVLSGAGSGPSTPADSGPLFVLPWGGIIMLPAPPVPPPPLLLLHAIDVTARTLATVSKPALLIMPHLQ